MGYWLFKVAEQERYPDEYGVKYVYDNTHSVRLKKGDEFIYLDKRRGHKLTGAGKIKRLITREASESEKRTERVTTIFTALLSDFIEFDPPLDISNTEEGRKNRKRIGAPENLVAWGISMIKLSPEKFTSFLNAALEPSNSIEVKDSISSETEIKKEIPSVPLIPHEEWTVEDSYSIVKKRTKLEKFRRVVLERHRYQCIVCGSAFKPSLEAAHIREYAEDPTNRANPANGICLCKYCHSAFDSDYICIHPSGELLIREGIKDKIANIHFNQVDKKTRKEWLNGVDLEFLKERTQKFQLE